jgi:hypothetical protein
MSGAGVRARGRVRRLDGAAAGDVVLAMTAGYTGRGDVPLGVLSDNGLQIEHHIGHHRLLAGFTRILTACARVLRPGGHMVITVRPWREHAELIDLPSQVVACGIAAGLVPVERCVALLARVADTDLVARGSFFQRDFIRKQRDAGLPLHLIDREDVIVLRAREECYEGVGGNATLERRVPVSDEYGVIGPGYWVA